MKILTFFIKYIAFIILGFILFLVAYFSLAFALPHLHVNTKFVEPKDSGVTIYITSNGVHTDLVVPSKNEVIDWEKTILRKDYPGIDSSFKWISFGWGDKGFYLETPTWADLKFSVAFKAVFYLSTTAMHVAYEKTPPFDKVACYKIIIRPEQYATLVGYIQSGFRYDQLGHVELLPNHGYAENDRFYEAIGRYGFAKTCNSWTNNGLKITGIKTGYWTPFQSGILEQFEK